MTFVKLNVIIFNLHIYVHIYTALNGKVNIFLKPDKFLKVRHLFPIKGFEINNIKYEPQKINGQLFCGITFPKFLGYINFGPGSMGKTRKRLSFISLTRNVFDR